MRILTGKLWICALLIHFFCFPSALLATEKITTSRIVLANSATLADLSTETAQGKVSRNLARRDIYEIIFCNGIVQI